VLVFRDIDQIVNTESPPSIPQTWLGDLIYLCKHRRGIYIIATTEHPELLTNHLLQWFHRVYHVPLPVHSRHRVRIARVMRRTYGVRDRSLSHYLSNPDNTVGWSHLDIEMFVVLWVTYRRAGLDPRNSFRVPPAREVLQANIL
jgi:hypothetical protein